MMPETAPLVVEVTLKYEAVVNEIADAWAFIMSRFENVGPSPEIHIHPVTTAPPAMLQAILGRDPQNQPRKFHVVVEGTVQENADGSPVEPGEDD